MKDQRVINASAKSPTGEPVISLTDKEQESAKDSRSSSGSWTSDQSGNASITSLENLDEATMKMIDSADSLDDWLKLQSKLKVERSNENIKKVMLFAKAKLDGLTTEEEKKRWVREMMTGICKDSLPDSLIEVGIAQFFAGDSGASVDERPDWLDIDKFRRGQAFAVKYMFAISYADFLSLLTVFSFEDGLRTLVTTGASSTPYTAFKRYYSTQLRVRNWYTSDPWTPGTQAYKDVNAVRKLHALVRKRMSSLSTDELKEKSTIKQPWCPALKLLRDDFQSTCPAPAPGQCPYTAVNRYPELKFNHLNQGEMSSTQFAFVGLIVTYPKFFGLHDVSEEDIEAFCHVWRGLGYLLGIEDDYNFCRGTLADIRLRTHNILEYWVKPNFRTVNPEWEHMMRCMIEGMQYYFPGVTYEIAIMEMAHLLNLHMPRFWNAMPYIDRLRCTTTRFYFDQCCKIPALRSMMNYRLKQVLDKVKGYDENKHKALERRSAKTLDAYALKTKQNNVMEKYSKFDHVAQM